MKVKFSPASDEKNDDYSLTPGNIYRVIELIINKARIMNDEGEPILYPLSWFSIVDEKWPDDWVTRYGKDGEHYVGPACLSEPGFFEDYFDGKKEAVRIFRQRIRKWSRGED